MRDNFSGQTLCIKLLISFFNIAWFIFQVKLLNIFSLFKKKKKKIDK